MTSLLVKLNTVSKQKNRDIVFNSRYWLWGVLVSFSTRPPPPEAIIAPPLPSQRACWQATHCKKKTKQNKRQEKLEEEIILYENVFRKFR